MSLSSTQIAFLKGIAHDKKPIILLGHKGITEAVVKETGLALLAHELIKVRLTAEEKDALDEEARDIAAKSGALLVERRGKVATLFKRHPEEPKIIFPKKKKAPSSSSSTK